MDIWKVKLIFVASIMLSAVGLCRDWNRLPSIHLSVMNINIMSFFKMCYLQLCV